MMKNWELVKWRKRLIKEKMEMYYTDGGRSKNRDSTFSDYLQQHTYSLLLKSGDNRAS